MKKIFFSLLLFITISMSSSCNLGEVLFPNLTTVYSTDYFYYLKRSSECIDIGGLTALGEQQKVIIIPSSIDGIAVTHVGWKPLMGSSLNNKTWRATEYLKKVYVPYFYVNGRKDGVRHRDRFFSVEMLVFHLDSIEGYDTESRITFGTVNFYYDSLGPNWENYRTYSRRFTIYDTGDEFLVYDGNVANVNYLYNYPDAPNLGYYFLDDVINDVITYTPEEPFREGYNFLGWYKEAECINQWDFETDIVPGYLSRDEEIGYVIVTHNITYLFAKWEEIK